MSSSVDPVVAALELAASEHEELLDFHVHVLLHSSMRFAMVDLALLLDVELKRVGVTVYQACLDLDKLERKRAWREARDLIEDPNVVALYQVCLARAQRVQGITRRRRLEAVSRKLSTTYEYARTWARIQAFLGSGGARSEEAQGANR